MLPEIDMRWSDLSENELMDVLGELEESGWWESAAARADEYAAQYFSHWDYHRSFSDVYLRDRPMQIALQGSMYIDPVLGSRAQITAMQTIQVYVPSWVPPEHVKDIAAQIIKEKMEEAYDLRDQRHSRLSTYAPAGR